MLINTKSGALCSGRVAKDPETRTVKDTCVTKFSIIYGKSDEIGSNGKPKVLFLSVDCWGSLGDTAALLSKGDSCLVWGEIQSRDYNGKTYHTLRAENLTFGAETLLKCASAVSGVSSLSSGEAMAQGEFVANPAISDATQSFTPISEDEDLPF